MAPLSHCTLSSSSKCSWSIKLLFLLYSAYSEPKSTLAKIYIFLTSMLIIFLVKMLQYWENFNRILFFPWKYEKTCPNVKNSKIYVDLRLHEIQFSDLPQIINALSVLLHQLVLCPVLCTVLLYKPHLIRKLYFM